jgi:hypothetical protein
MSTSKPTYLNVLIVEEFKTASGKGRNWTKVGVAFPHSEGIGFNIELKAFPRDGKLVVLPPQTDSTDDRTAGTARASKSSTAKDRSR